MDLIHIRNLKQLVEILQARKFIIAVSIGPSLAWEIGSILSQNMFNFYFKPRTMDTFLVVADLNSSYFMR
jgi:hypothetical protein